MLICFTSKMYRFLKKKVYVLSLCILIFFSQLWAKIKRNYAGYFLELHCILRKQQFMLVLLCLKLLIKTLKSHLKKKTNLNKVFLKIVMVLLNYWTSWCWFLHSPVTCSWHTDDLGRLLTLWYRIQVHSKITPILNKPKQLKIHSLSLYLTVTVITAFLLYLLLMQTEFKCIKQSLHVEE